MNTWFTNYWWLLAALVFVGGLVTYRMRKRGGDESTLRRIMYALFPESDPVNRPQREISVLWSILIGGGLLLVMVVYLLHAEFR